MELEYRKFMASTRIDYFNRLAAFKEAIFRKDLGDDDGEAPPSLSGILAFIRARKGLFRDEMETVNGLIAAIGAAMEAKEAQTLDSNRALATQILDRMDDVMTSLVSSPRTSVAPTA